MSFFPPKKVPGLAWPEVPLGEGAQVWSLYLTLERTQWLAPEEIVAGQLAQVRSLLTHCREHIPYYRELLDGAGIAPEDIRTLADFRRIPLLQRSAWMDQFPRLQARALPPGIVKTSNASSGGTSGVPVELWQTNRVNLWWLAFCLRDIAWCGIETRGRVACLRVFPKSVRAEASAAGLRLPYWHPGLRGVLETGPLFGMDIQVEPRRQIQWLMEVAPDFLMGYPSNLQYVANLLAESGQRLPSLRVIQCISETLSDDARAAIEAGFGVPVKNTYSCSEAGYLASPCPEGHGLHVHAENVLLEVLNDDNQPCAPGETGRVIVTTLQNHATPFIRYDIQDTVTLGPERCPCGRGLPLFTQVHGKVRPLFILPGGRRVASSRLAQYFRGLELCYQYQIIQRGFDHFVVRLIPSRQWNADSPARVEQFFRDYIEMPVRVEIELVEKLAGPSGKVNAVLIELPS